MTQLLALIELGSNATRLLLAEVTMGAGYRVLQQKRVQTRLAGGPERDLPRRAVRDTLAAVRGFVRSFPSGNGVSTIAVATAAVRDAENRATLLNPLIHKYGLNVVVLSPHDEACLGTLAVLHHLPMRDGLVADLGGGSLQLTSVRAGRVENTASLPIGAVRMTERFLRGDPPAAAEVTALRSEVRERLHRAMPFLKCRGHLVGIGGTVRALASLQLAARTDEATRHGLRLSQDDIIAMRARVEALPLSRRQGVPGLRPERADIIVAGALVVEELVRASGYPELTVCTFGVRDGYLIRRTFPDSWPLHGPALALATALAAANPGARRCA
jgi:exopolyphosphatase/guanosine-5'-triphosphate,3'-diphosphate pyrophosphatase